MSYKDTINKVAISNNIPVEIVDKAYKSFWLYIRNSIQKLPLKENLSEQEFLLLRPNFNIPSLGKLTCTYKRYKGVKERFKYIKEIRKRNEKTT